MIGERTVKHKARLKCKEYLNTGTISTWQIYLHLKILYQV